MQGARCSWRSVLAVFPVAMLLGSVGCIHNQRGMAPQGYDAVHAGAHSGMPPIAVPPPGTVPTELSKANLPPYVIEAPDNLLIEVVIESEIEDEVTKQPKRVIDRLPVQPISGQFQVRIDGSVGLGYWGSVPIAGLTLEQAADAIRHYLIQSDTLQRLKIKPENVVVIVDVLAYNSKRYYVITDGGGYGEQVFPFPVTGSETVLDALANVNGLPAVASRRNIWVARRTPHPDQPWQILPVDWVGITQHGITATNYQLLPGDRIYVKAQRLVTIDTALARILSPVERMFGVTLLGAATVNQIKGRGFGFGGGAAAAAAIGR